MNRLIIITKHAVTVELLLTNEQLIEPHSVTTPYSGTLHIAYPDDGLSQALTYWLAMAQGCKLIEQYEFHTRIPISRK